MSRDEYGDEKPKNPKWWTGDFLVTREYLKDADEQEEYERKRDSKGLFTLVVYPEDCRSDEAEKALFAEYAEATERGSKSEDVTAELEKKYPKDTLKWIIVLKVPKSLLEQVDRLKSGEHLSKKERINNQWRFTGRKGLSSISARWELSMEETFMNMYAEFKTETDAREFAFGVAWVLNDGRPVIVQQKSKVSGDNSAVAKAFTVWLTQKMKGETGDLWSPAPKAGGSWVYGSTVTTFNAETGSSLAFMGLCSALDRKPQVKDGKKRVLVLTTELSS